MRKMIYVVLVGGLVFGCRRSETDPTTSGKELSSMLLSLVGSGKELTLLERAQQGDASSQFELGLKFAKGDGVEKNLDEAARWYRKAADQGDASAQCNLGFCYYNGLGVAKDLSEAFRLFEASANQGNADAQANLASMYELGQATPKDDSKALEYCLKAANGGSTRAQYLIGTRYESGRGVPKSFAIAKKWYLEAANSGDVGAELKLGIFSAVGRGCLPDKSTAIKWLTQAKSKGGNLIEIRERAKARSLELDEYERSEIAKHIEKYHTGYRKTDLPPDHVRVGGGRYALNPNSPLAQREREFDNLQVELQRTRPMRQREYSEMLTLIEIIESVLKQ